MKQQQIIFVTGKGGVGKSTLAAAIAEKHAQSGSRVLLVELVELSFYREFYNLQQVGYNPQEIQKNLFLAKWTGPECLREYGVHLVKNEKLLNLFFDTPAIRALINVAPALSELAILGKITSGHRKVGPSMDYDYIVIDSFATGHFKALLQGPLGILEAVKLGPMATQRRSILEVLKDPQKTSYNIVTLAEELPFVETKELVQDLKNLIQVEAHLVLNKSMAKNLSLEDCQITNSNVPNYFSEYLIEQKLKNSQFKSDYLKIDPQTEELSYVLDTNPQKIVSQLMGELKS